MKNNIIASYFIPHWWWPRSLMWEEYMKKTWEIDLKKYLNNLWKKYNDLDAIIIISSHRETNNIAISFVEDYSLLYDYYWFPENTYNVDYKVKWDLKLSEKVEKSLNDNWIKTIRDTKRWLDHGSFIPLMEIFPDIKIPVIQVSISSNLDSRFHFNLWKALSWFKKENILILWSWMSYHNMGWFFSDNEKYTKESILFNEFLENNKYNLDNLLNWELNPISENIHTRAEHFMPFFVILWTSINWEITRDCKIFNHGIEIVWYKVD